MQTWIFQAVPGRYDLGTELQPGREERWRVTRYADKIRAGDLVYMWSAERRIAMEPERLLEVRSAGIFGWGVTLGQPEPTTETGVPHRVRIRFIARFDPPARKDDLARLVPALLSHPLYTVRRGTNFQVDDDLAQALQRALAELGHIPPSDPADWIVDDELFARLSPRSRRVLGTSHEIIKGSGQDRVHMEHLLHALLQMGPPRARFLSAGLNERAVLRRLADVVGYTPPNFGLAEADRIPPTSDHVRQALLNSAAIAGSNRIRTHDLLAGALAVTDCSVIKAFPELLPPEPGREEVGGVGGAANDEVAHQDQLGFGDYVQAFADLIESPHTEPPVTIGVYGSWGMGKSFLLQNVAAELERRQHYRDLSTAAGRAETESHRLVRVFTVTFNAWEYSAHDKVWPGLVRRIMDHLERSIRWSRHGRFVSGLRRKLQREAMSPLGFALIALVVLSALVFLGGVAVGGTEDLEILATTATLFAGSAGALLLKTLATPWGKWVTRLVERQDYGRQSEGMADIRDDLEFLQGRLAADGGRILVLIDDLDRCEPAKAVEVLQAIKLLLNFKSFVVMLGIDARVVTRAVEKHYEGLLGPAGASGYEYLDKIVQIPFRIPEPEDEALEKFVHAQLGQPAERTEERLDENRGPEPEVQGPGGPADRGTARAGDAVVVRGVPTSELPSRARVIRSLSGELTDVGASPPGRTSPPRQAESAVEKPSPPGPARSVDPFTYREYQAFKALVPYLRPNPRHIKRLINVYRLVRSLAQLKDEKRVLDNPEATILVLLLCAQWPYTLQRMLAAIPAVMRELGEGGDGRERYPAQPPLDCLLQTAGAQVVAEIQDRLDDDQTRLAELLGFGSGRVEWTDLEAIRRYTVNFNPAVEGELYTPKKAAPEAEA